MKILHVIDTCDPKTGGPIEGIKQLNYFYLKTKSIQKFCLMILKNLLKNLRIIYQK